MSDIIEQLEVVLEARKGADKDSSYVASLYHKGLDGILKKIGEEATEVVIAAKDGAREQQVYELADLWFHCLVLMRFHDIQADDVYQELARRFGLSGIEEKRSRKS
jgi:phosphoribosyl-ATP pyrophosphohydrolase